MRSIIEMSCAHKRRRVRAPECTARSKLKLGFATPSSPGRRGRRQWHARGAKGRAMHRVGDPPMANDIANPRLRPLWGHRTGLRPSRPRWRICSVDVNLIDGGLLDG